MTLPRSGVQLVAEGVQDFKNQMAAAQAAAAEADTAIASLISTADGLRGALDGLGSDINVSVNITDNKSTVEQDIKDIGAMTATPTIDPTFDTQDPDYKKITDLDSEKFDPEIDPKLNDTNGVLNEVTSIDDTPYDPQIDPKLNDPQGTLLQLDALDNEPIQPDIDPQTTNEDSKETLKVLKAINAKEKFEIFMDVAGPILDVLKQVGRYTVGSIIGQEADINRLQATLGLTADQAERLYKISSGIYAQGLGIDEKQVQGVVTLGKQLDILPTQLQEAATGALNVTKVFQDQNPEQVLKTMNILVESGLVKNFKEASDLIYTGLSSGANKGGDFLSVMERNANKFKEMGLNGQEALNLIDSGLKSGFTSAGNIDNAIRSFVNKLGEAGSDRKNKTNVALKQLGLENPAATGKEVGADFLNSVIDSIKNNPGKGMTQQELVEAIFGKEAKSGAGITALLGLDAKSDMFKPMKDAAQSAADTMGKSLDDMLGDFMRRVEVAARDFLSSDQIGLKAKIDEITNGVQRAIDVLTKGGTIGQALEIGFKIQGVDTFILNFERIVGNLEIGFLQVVAAIQDITNNGEAAKATRATVAKQSEGQLAFDLKVANPDEVAGMVKQATDRGVDAAGLGKAFTTAYDELTKSGQFEKAQSLLDQVKQMSNGYTAGTNVSAMNTPGQLEALAAKANAGQLSPEQIQEAIQGGYLQQVSVAPMIDQDAFQKDLDSKKDQMQKQVQDLLKFSPTTGAGDLLKAENIAKDLGDGKTLLDVFNTAIKAGNLDVAAAAIQDLKGHNAELQQAFSDTLKLDPQHNLGIAQAVANATDDPTFKKSVENLGNMLRNTFQHDMDTGNFKGAMDAAKLIGDPNLVREARDKLYDLKQDQKDIQAASDDTKSAVVKNNADMSKSYDDLSKASSKAIHKQSVVPDLKDIKTAADQSIPSAIKHLNAMRDSLAGLGNLTPTIQGLINLLKNLDTTASIATGKANDAAAAASSVHMPLEHHDAGGKMGYGTSVVGETGPELVTNIPGADVLNSRTTQAIMAAITGTAGHNVTNNTSSTHQMITQVNNNYSPAQEANASYRLGALARGMNA